MEHPQLSQPEQETLLTELGRILASAVLDDWEELHFAFAGVYDVTMPTMSVVRPDGSSFSLTPPRKASRVMRELRDGTYRPGRGAWFTARYVVEQSGQHRMEYDYEREPCLDFALSDTSYATDLERYPRDPQHVPGWLREKLTRLSS